MKLRISLLLPAIAILVVSCNKEPLMSDQGTFIDDRDNHSYSWVKVGTQVWMAENLGYLPSVSTSAQASQTEPHYYVYGNESNSVTDAKASSHYTEHGALYNYEAALIACPDGWHLPDDSEWKKLSTSCGLLPGKKLKSTSEWKDDGNGNNLSGLNIHPAGTQYTLADSYSDLGRFSFFWTSVSGEYRFLSWNNDRVDSWDRFISLSTVPLSFGFSVRCVQD